MTGEQKVAEGFRFILEGLGLTVEGNPHLEGTPERAARAWYNEICKGVTHPPPRITAFPSDRDQMIVLRDIPVLSVCAHHLLPFVGTAAVGYIPGTGEILGLSKLSRIVDHWSRRPQVQEELTEQVADALGALVTCPEGTGQGGVGVVIRASHMCMSLRGVKHTGDMVTSALRGVFRTFPEVREEFLALTR